MCVFSENGVYTGVLMSDCLIVSVNVLYIVLLETALMRIHNKHTCTFKYAYNLQFQT